MAFLIKTNIRSSIESNFRVSIGISIGKYNTFLTSKTCNGDNSLRAQSANLPWTSGRL